MAKRNRPRRASPASAPAVAATRAPIGGDVAGLGLVLLVGALVYGWIAAWDRSTISFTDSLDYLTLADHFGALLRGEQVPHARDYFLSTRFPPLFPLLLALVGADSAHPQAASWFSCATAVGGAATTWWWVRRERGDARAATLLALALLLLPHYFLRNLTPISEPLALLLLTGLFAFLTRRPLTLRMLLIASIVIGLMPLVRSAFLPLGVAFLIWLAIARPLPFRQLAAPALLAWLPYVAWTLHRRALGADQYASLLTAKNYAIAEISLPSALWVQPWRLVEATAALWSDVGGPVALAAAALVMLLAGVGCVLRLRENRLDAWFLAGYIALLLVWPFPTETARFLMGVYPLLLVSALSAIGAIARRWPARLRRLPPWALLVALPIAVASTPTALTYAQRASLVVPEPLLGDKREPAVFLAASDDEARLLADVFGRTRLLLAEANTRLPADACVYALPPHIVRAFTGRRGEPYPTDLADDPETARAALTRCDWFLVFGWRTNRHSADQLYPSQALRGWTEVVLASNARQGERRMTAAALLRRTANEGASQAASPAPSSSAAEHPRR